MGCFTVILSLVFAQPFKLESFFRGFGISKVNWDQNWNYRINGMLLGTLLNLTDEVILPPQNYSRESILTLFKSESNSASSAKRPLQSMNSPIGRDKLHVLIYMFEALWDPRLPMVQFNRDPIPTFHRLQREGSAGSLLVPVYGGGTANTEFEVLSGMSTYFQPPETIAFVEYLKNPTASLASIFKNHGYRALAVHNYNRFFYSRNIAYPLLGFDHFYSLEEMGGYQSRRGYPTDDVLVRALIGLIDAAKTPLFIHAVSMETHNPYTITLPQMPVKTLQTPLQWEINTQIETYASALSYADESLEKLTKALAAVPQNVVLIVFGDHLPSLGEDYKAYVDTGFISQSDTSHWSPDEWIKMRSTPLVIWKNHEMSHHSLNTQSANCLSNEILKQAGIEFDRFHQFTDRLCNQIPLLSSSIVIDKNLRPLQVGKAPRIQLPKIMLDYETLIYDRTLGEGYSE
jgi:phosphoglycerol transferase MdoB-like AlkP superfamily enzyme